MCAQLGALLDEREVREALEPERVAEILLARAVVHHHDDGERRAREVGREPFELGVRDAHLDVLSLERVQHDDVEAAAVQRVEEGALVSPDASEVVSSQVDRVVVAGHVDELGLRGAEDVLALRVASEVGVAALVLDVVAEVDEEVGAQLVVHGR